MEQFPTLESNRLLLREHIDKDLNDFYEIISNKEAVKYWGTPPLIDLSVVEEKFYAIKKHLEQGFSISWAIILKDNDKYIGNIKFFDISKRHNRGNIGILLSPLYWNQRIATEASKLVIHYLFVELNVNRIQAFIDSKHSISLKTFQSLGFRNEGLLEEYEYEYENNCFKDLYLLSLLRKNYDRK